MVTRASRRTGVPEWLLRALVGQESGGRQSAVSSAGARGVAQLMPGTARRLEQTYGINTRSRYGNLLGGAYYLKEQLDRFHSVDLALAAYNAGPGAVEKYGGIPPYKETQDYVRSILGKKPGGGAVSANGVQALPSLSQETAPPSVQPSYTEADALKEGLAALSSGHYDPMKGLAALQKAAEATAQAQLTNMKRRQNIGSLSFPVFASGAKATPLEARAASIVQKYLGVNYVWGGSTPQGFDCSGLLQWVWSHLGVKIPRTTYEQFGAGKAVGRGQLRPGDAVFFRGSDSKGGLPGHVGMYIGNGLFVEAPHTGAQVRISKLRGRSDFVGARRYA